MNDFLVGTPGLDILDQSLQVIFIPFEGDGSGV